MATKAAKPGIRHKYVRKSAISVEIERFCSPRVPLSLCHDVVIAVEPLDGHSMRHATFIADQQVELAPLQLNSNQVRVRGSERDSHGRPRELLGTGDQSYSQHSRHVVAASNRKGTVRTQGIERRRTLDHSFKVLEREMEGDSQLHRAWGQNHASPALRRDQQRIVKHIAEACELSRESRLADVQSLRGLGHVRLLDEGVERDQKIKVGPSEIDHADT